MRISNSFGTKFSGTLRKDMIASTWKGIPYIRSYTVPVDPKSEMQLEHRALFAKAVETWHGLDPHQQKLYNKRARRMTGYNLFLREYIKAVRDGREPEIMQVPDEASQAKAKRKR